jgi:hypothetical protein
MSERVNVVFERSDGERFWTTQKDATKVEEIQRTIEQDPNPASRIIASGVSDEEAVRLCDKVFAPTTIAGQHKLAGIMAEKLASTPPELRKFVSTEFGMAILHGGTPSLPD